MESEKNLQSQEADDCEVFPGEKQTKKTQTPVGTGSSFITTSELAVSFSINKKSQTEDAIDSQIEEPDPIPGPKKANENCPIRVEESAVKSDDTSESVSISQRKGAQILMSRFSAWKSSANERAATILKTKTPALEENAKQAQEYFSSFATRFPTIRSPASSVKPVTSTEKKLDEIKSATLESDDVKVDEPKETVAEDSSKLNEYSNTASLMDTAVLSDGDEEQSDDSSVDDENGEGKGELSGGETSSRADTDRSTSTATYGGET
ncbi:MAG: hypothetical protein AAGM67_18740, partial [Bacteroidota bacterium]